MPLIRSLASKRYIYIMAVILLLSKIMPTYSCYMLKGLVYIIIIALLDLQSSFYIKYIKLNIYSFYNIRLVFNTKCMPFICLTIL